MNRGCISSGAIKCDECHRDILYLERYLVIEETEDTRQRLCIDCCQKKGYVHSKMEKGKQVSTFFEE